MKRGSFKASQLQPGDRAAAGRVEDDAEVASSAFNAPAPPLVGAEGGGGGQPGTLPEGMYFIGVGVFMMQVV